MSAEHLDGHHRATVEKIFTHPTGHNIQWHDVISLLEQVGTVEETHKATSASPRRRVGRPRATEARRPHHPAGDRCSPLLEHAEVTPATTGS